MNYVHIIIRNLDLNAQHLSIVLLCGVLSLARFFFFLCVCKLVIGEVKKEKKKTPLGYYFWWLYLDQMI